MIVTEPITQERAEIFRSILTKARCAVDMCDMEKRNTPLFDEKSLREIEEVRLQWEAIKDWSEQMINRFLAQSDCRVMPLPLP